MSTREEKLVHQVRLKAVKLVPLLFVVDIITQCE